MVYHIAHRGFPDNKYKDNSIEAIYNAIDHNFEMIEIDIQVCKTGDIILYHDLMIGGKLIQECTLEFLEKEHNLLQLKDILPLLEKIEIYLDLKGSFELAPALDLLLEKFTFLPLQKLWVASFDQTHLDYLVSKKKLPFKLGLITYNIFSVDLFYNMIEHMDFYVGHWGMMYPEIIEKLRERNKKIFTFTISTTKELDFIRDVDLDGLVTDILIK